MINIIFKPWKKISSLFRKHKGNDNMLLSKNLQVNHSDVLKSIDLYDFIELKKTHDTEFLNWCKANPHAGTEDELDHDIAWIGKVIEFLIQRKYML